MIVRCRDPGPDDSRVLEGRKGDSFLHVTGTQGPLILLGLSELCDLGQDRLSSLSFPF